MIEYEDRKNYWNDFKKYLEKVNISDLETDIDLAVFFKKFIENQYKKRTFKEFFEMLLNNRWRGEIHFRNDIYSDNANYSDNTNIIDFRNLTLEDYKFVEEHKDSEYNVLQYFEYLTYPPIPCYVISLKE